MDRLNKYQLSDLDLTKLLSVNELGNYYYVFIDSDDKYCNAIWKVDKTDKTVTVMPFVEFLGFESDTTEVTVTDFLKFVQ